MQDQDEDKDQEKEPTVVGTILKVAWENEKSTWRWAAGLGLIGAVLLALAGGFFGYAAYGYLGMVGGAIAGAIVGWIIATLIFYVLLATATFFN